MLSGNEGARTYFDHVPRQWDAIYSHENRLMYALNRLLRKGIFERHELTFGKCGDIPGASVLDLGCGTGRYSVEFARRGASTVLGVDFAPSMVEFSRRIARDMGVADRCEFICGDVLTVPTDQPFDIVAALGLFDYLAEPEQLIKRISCLTSRVFVASFPSYGFLGRLQRRIRYGWIKKCSVHHYSRARLQELFSPSFPSFEIVPITSGFFVAAKKR
ncbi:MAG: methyltransferase domain-containing protein [Desulfomonile tiedjei]|uniref:Methyltransferase domain-containing protein n=1 Tax=Desulfomonile tiedjei TaxID=2358 RepID=A0A9D6V3M4_9BACT|nr:methyltransferase domain-containing protein [Desulfomonile tiedjei]